MAGNMLCVSICSQLGKWRFPRGLQQAAVACLWNNRVPLVANSARGVLTSREGMDGAAGQQSWLPAGRPLISRLGSPVCLAVGMKGLMAPLTLASALAGGGVWGCPGCPRQHHWQSCRRLWRTRHRMHPITRCTPSHDAPHHTMRSIVAWTEPKRSQPRGRVPRLVMRRLAHVQHSSGCLHPASACKGMSLPWGCGRC